MPSEELRRRFPAQLKIGPVEKIGDLVTLGLPGVPVHAVPVAPRQIPFHAGFAYFELDQTNELWDQLKTSGGVALHVAGEFPGLGDGVLGDPQLIRDSPMPDNDDPFNRPDATLLRPRPGGGKHGAGDATRPRPAAPLVTDAEPIPAAARALLGVGLNPLVQAASPLLLLAGQLRGALSPMDVAGLRRHALEEIRRFEEHARASGVPNEIVLAARYALCAGLDEAVLSTPWGAQSEWAQHPLLVTLHREAWGGEKFFEMLDRISADPARHIDLMELQYLCIAFGFGGKYQVARSRARAPRGGPAAISIARSAIIAAQPEPELSLRWRGLEDRRNRLDSVCALVGRRRGGAGDPRDHLHRVLRQPGASCRSGACRAREGRPRRLLAAAGRRRPFAGPTLKQLLAPDEAAGAVERRGDRRPNPGHAARRATCSRSGSATVNPRTTIRRFSVWRKR